VNNQCKQELDTQHVGQSLHRQINIKLLIIDRNIREFLLTV